MADSPQTLLRPTWLEIDRQWVVDNFLQAQKRVGEQVAIFPVVKADGYGLGAVPISHSLLAAGAAGLCVGLLEEGAELRRAGIQKPIILFNGLTSQNLEELIELNLQPFIYDLQLARALDRAARVRNRRITCYVKVDSGMGRLGFAQDQLLAILQELQSLSALNIAGIVSHLACGDEAGQGEVTPGQIAVMQKLLTLPPVQNIAAGQHSLANSAGTLYYPESHLQWVRPGIMLYGASPAFPQRTYRDDGLVPVVRLLSRIIQIKTFPPGTPLGYGHTYKTAKTTKIAQIPIGYGDGYSRSLSNRGHVLLNGQRAPIVGRVCMDLTAIDISYLPNIELGQLVTLLGQDGADFIGIEDLASLMGTIPYEVICGLSKRLPRYYPNFDNTKNQPTTGCAAS